jgi:hypothetical protein
LSTVDPTGKILSAVGGGLFMKVGGKIDGLVVARIARVLDDVEVKKTLERIKSKK